MKFLPILVAVISGCVIGYFGAKTTSPQEKGGSELSATTKSSTATVKAQATASPRIHSHEEAVSIFQKLSQVEITDYQSLMEDILKLPKDSALRESSLELLLPSWALADPEGALGYVNKLKGDSRTQGLQIVLQTLGEGSFEETQEWMAANLRFIDIQTLSPYLFLGFAKKDPHEALATINNLEDNQMKKDCLLTVVGDWAEKDAVAAFDWFENAPWSKPMRDVYKQIIDSYMDQDPEGAFELIQTIDEDSYWRARYSKDLASKLASTDPKRALEIAETITDEGRKEEALTSVFEDWSNNDPEQALASALEYASKEGLEDSAKNDINRQAAFGLLWQKPELLREKYPDLPEDIRHEIVGPMLDTWIPENEEAATEWVRTFDPESIEYNLGMSSIAGYYTDWDPELSLELASRITYNDIRFDREYEALKNLYRKDQGLALEVLASGSLVSKEINQAFEIWTSDYEEREILFVLPPGS